MLELSHVSKTYRTGKGVKVHALKDVNLKFADHGMVFILGKSGSGKSTLLNIIGGLDQADSGELMIHQKSTKSFSQADFDAYRNTYVGFIFQEFYLIEEYTIEKNIALSYQLQQKEADHEQIAQILETVGLKGYENRYPNELSGGQKQRVAIARSLIKKPQILMADEPTGALDSATGKDIFTTLKELSKEKLVIVVSHDEEAAKTYADRIITFSDGEVTEDTNAAVEADQQEFVPIASHLPFKDCFHLGITCFNHKKLRMIFTILLTSFALLCLALSDCIGQFNGANAQYKAMQEHDEHLLSIQRNDIDADGNVYIGWQDRMNEINKADAVKLINALPQKTAKQYDSALYQFNSVGMGIQVKERNAYYDSGLDHFYLTEANDFSAVGYDKSSIIGHFPKNNQEIAISSYLADLIIEHGINDQQGKLIKPKNETELLEKVQLPILDQWLNVSAIVKEKDYSKYKFLHTIPEGQMKEEEYNQFRKFYSQVQQNSSYLYVKDGFVQSVQPEKSNYLNRETYQLMYQEESLKNGNITYGDGMAYPKKTLTYYDGNQLRQTDYLQKHEVLWSLSELDNYHLSASSGFPSLYDDAFTTLPAAEKERIIKDMAKQVIGKKFTMRYENYFNNSALIEQKITIKGVILPDNYGMNMLDAVEHTSYVNKELLEPHISDPLYLGGILISADGNECRKLLENYPIDQEFYAKTMATNDVQSIKSFAEFATKVFFIASIAFFIFAAVLMMNFIVVSITYRRKDIGILRSIGARSVDVIKIFIWEALVLAVIAYIVTLISLFVISFLVNQYAMETVGIVISPVIITLRQPLLLIVIVLLIAFISGAVPILRIARQRPIDAIKKR